MTFLSPNTIQTLLRYVDDLARTQTFLNSRYKIYFYNGTKIFSTLNKKGPHEMYLPKYNIILIQIFFML
jgi:hypothetical protein